MQNFHNGTKVLNPDVVVKMMSFVIAMVMTLALGITVFAAGEGTLTVKNSEADVTYNFYKIFDLTGQDTSDPADNLYDAVVYTIDSDWAAFFNGDGATYISATNTGDLNPIKIDGVTKYINITETNKVAFTNAAMKYAIDEGLTADKTAAGNASADVSVTGLDLGYYLMIPVDQTDEKTNPLTTGTVASLTSTIPTADIYVKATKPTIGKTDTAATVDVGQTITYTVTGKVPNTSGTETFVYQISDTMTQGLTFQKDVVVTVAGVDDPITADCTIDYTTDTQGFTCTIPVYDLQDYKGAVITLTYHAVVNDDAVERDEVHNTAQLKYGRNPDDLQESTPISEEVYTTKIVINKYTGNDATNGTKLPDAVFALMKIDNGTAKYYKYTAASGTTPASVTWVEVTGAPTSGTATVTDAMATALANATTITKVTTDADGAGEFPGIADGTYYLVEIAAPEGYNRLDTPQEVVVTGNDVDDGETSIENTANATGEFDSHNIATADVNNATGTALPSTGGIGTTIFYVIGAILVLGAGILLVTRRRMNAN